MGGGLLATCIAVFSMFSSLYELAKSENRNQCTAPGVVVNTRNSQA